MVVLLGPAEGDSQALAWVENVIANIQSTNDQWVRELLVDKDSNVHALVSVRYPHSLGVQVLYYRKFDKKGDLLCESRIPDMDKPQSTKMHILQDGTVALVCLGWENNHYFHVGHDGIIKNHQLNFARGSDFSFVDSDNGATYLIVLSDWGWVFRLDEEGYLHKVSEKKFRTQFLMTRTEFARFPSNTFIMGWQIYHRVKSDLRQPKRERADSIFYAILDTALSFLEMPRSISLVEYSDRIGDPKHFPFLELVGTASGAILFASGNDGTAYRVRFDAEGNPVKPVAKQGMGVITLSEYWRQSRHLRLGFVKNGERGESRDSFLFGFTSEGEIFYQELDTAIKLAPR